MRSRTTLIIAHRLSTIALAGRDRRARQTAGSPPAARTSELIETSPVYREIYEHGLLEQQFVDAVEARGEMESVA